MDEIPDSLTGSPAAALLFQAIALALGLIARATFEYNPSDYNFFGFTPNLACAIVYVVVFSLLTILHIGLTIRSRAWSGVLAILGGLCEIGGWIGRLGGHYSTDGLAYYLLQQILTVIAPVFFSAMCYTLFGKLIILQEARWARYGPKAYIIFFVTVDVICLVLQGIGGGMSGGGAGAGNFSTVELGRKIYLSGICFQLANTILFAYLVFEYFWRMKKESQIGFRNHEKPLQRLAVGLTVVNVLIIVRNIFRVCELAEGFDGHLATTEVYFATLDALPMVLAFAMLAYSHPIFTTRRISSSFDREGKMQE